MVDPALGLRLAPSHEEEPGVDGGDSARQGLVQRYGAGTMYQLKATFLPVRAATYTTCTSCALRRRGDGHRPGTPIQCSAGTWAT